MAYLPVGYGCVYKKPTRRTDVLTSGSLPWRQVASLGLLTYWVPSCLLTIPKPVTGEPPTVHSQWKKPCVEVVRTYCQAWVLKGPYGAETPTAWMLHEKKDPSTLVYGSNLSILWPPKEPNLRPNTRTSFLGHNMTDILKTWRQGKCQLLYTSSLIC